MKPQHISQKLALLRWEIALSGFCLAVGLVAWYGLAPLAGVQIRAFARVKQDMAFPGRAEQLPQEIAAVRAKAARLDSLLLELENPRVFNEAEVLDILYSLADSAACDVGKVRIGEPVGVEGGAEIPIVFDGSGSYAAIGRFIDGIENMEYATRVRQVTMKAHGGDRGGVSVDFVIVE